MQENSNASHNQYSNNPLFALCTLPLAFLVTRKLHLGRQRSSQPLGLGEPEDFSLEMPPDGFNALPELFVAFAWVGVSLNCARGETRPDRDSVELGTGGDDYAADEGGRLGLCGFWVGGFGEGGVEGFANCGEHLQGEFISYFWVDGKRKGRRTV